MINEIQNPVAYFFRNKLFIDNTTNKPFAYGTNIPDGEYYHLQFSFPIDLGRKVYSFIRANQPEIFKALIYYKTRSGEKVYLGGKFHHSLKAKDFFYNTISQVKQG